MVHTFNCFGAMDASFDNRGHYLHLTNNEPKNNHNDKQKKTNLN